jgi:transposase
VHSTLIARGKPCPVSDLFGHSGRELLARLDVPEPWRSTLRASVIDLLDEEIRAGARAAPPRSRSPLHPAAAHGARDRWVLGFTIASELGKIERFASP